MTPIYTPEFLNALAKEGVDVDESTQRAHQAALEQNPNSIKPAKRKDTGPGSNSLFNFKTMGLGVPVKTLGKGSYGTVKKLVTQDGRVFAIKTSFYTETGDSHYALFFREKEALRALKRPMDSGTRVCNKGSYGNNNYGVYYKTSILTEFFDGPNGFNFINTSLANKTSIPLNTGLKLLSSMVMEVKSLHAAGLLHNDIKPENFVIINHHEQAKIIDFGFTAPLHEPASGFSKKYAAPEAKLSTERTVQTDVYSLGLTFRDFFRVFESGHFHVLNILYQLKNDMTSYEPADRPSLKRIENVLTFLQLLVNSSLLEDIKKEDCVDLFLLAIEHGADGVAIQLIDRIYHFSGAAGLDADDGSLLKAAIKSTKWEVASHLVSKDVNISLYKGWNKLAKSAVGEFLRNRFGMNPDNRELLLRILAIAVKQEIETLPADPRMAETRKTACSTLDPIIHHRENDATAAQARVVVQAITTCHLQGTFLHKTVWANIAASILRDYPSTVQTSTCFMTLFSSCFKQRSNDVIPSQTANKAKR